MPRTTFYVGLHRPWAAEHFENAFVSISTLRNRKSEFPAQRWIMDSGAFTEISKHGEYRDDVSVYAEQIERWADNATLVAAVAQDWMCEPFIIKRTGLSVDEHQKRTVQRYDDLMALNPSVYIMPVLQGYHPLQYLKHIRDYGDRLKERAWVGVGSVCKRNVRPESIVAVLSVIKKERPDLRLHGFGVKVKALEHPGVRAMLHSCDSMAWSYAARMEGRDQNSWYEAKRFEQYVNSLIAKPDRTWSKPLWV